MVAAVGSGDPNGIVVSADRLAADAGIAMFRAGGSAADAVVAAGVVVAVTSPHLNGPGGDLVAMYQAPRGEVECLLGIGRAGSGADEAAEAMRREGHAAVPQTGDIRSVTVPGAVDGWAALHERHGRLPWATVLEPGVRYATDGFPASAALAQQLTAAAAEPGALRGADELTARTPLRENDLVRRPLLGRALAAVARHGRDAWYRGEFAEGLIRRGEGLFDADDLAHVHSEWVAPLTLEAFGYGIAVPPAPTQGYLVPLAASLAERSALVPAADPTQRAHIQVEAARAAGYDRPERLYDGAHVEDLLTDRAVRERLAHIDPAQPGRHTIPATAGGTTNLVAVAPDGSVASLTQSNAGGFGSGSSSRRPAPDCTTGAPRSPSAPVTRRATRRAADRRTPWSR